MQFNLQVTIQRIEDGISFALSHFWISIPSPTRHCHTTQAHTTIHAPIALDWFHNLWVYTSSSFSSCHTEAISCCTQAARPVPPGLLLTNMAFMTAFHLFLSFFSSLICLSISLLLSFSLCSLNGILAPAANTLSSQSTDNDYHLNSCLIKQFPVCSNSTPQILPQNCSLMTSPEKVLSTVS